MNVAAYESRLRFRIYRLIAVAGWTAIILPLIGIPITVGIAYSLGDALITLGLIALAAALPATGLVMLTDTCIGLWAKVKNVELLEEEDRQREAERIIRDYGRRNP